MFSDWFRSTLMSAALLLVCMGSPVIAKDESASSSQPPSGFTALFDGHSLTGWRGDPRFWSVEHGAIVAKATTALDSNTFLYHDNIYRNFELHYKFRWLSSEGNSGVQIRSHVIEGNHDMTGPQVNVTPLAVKLTDANGESVPYKMERYNMLYDEKGDRYEMCLLGQRAVISRRSGKSGGAQIVRTVKEMVNRREDIFDAVRNGPEWTEVVVIAYDNRIMASINGMLAFDCIDDDPVRPKDGLIGLQLHSSLSSHFEFKDIFIKPLIELSSVEGRFRSKSYPSPEPVQTFKEAGLAGMIDHVFSEVVRESASVK